MVTRCPVHWSASVVPTQLLVQPRPGDANQGVEILQWVGQSWGCAGPTLVVLRRGCVGLKPVTRWSLHTGTLRLARPDQWGVSCAMACCTA